MQHGSTLWTSGKSELKQRGDAEASTYQGMCSYYSSWTDLAWSTGWTPHPAGEGSPAVPAGARTPVRAHDGRLLLYFSAVHAAWLFEFSL
jgi:hypothetical protein